MIESSSPLGPIEAADLGYRAPRLPSTARLEATPDFRVTLSQELEGPPPEVRAQVRDAARRWEELRAMGRELRFERDEETGRIVVQVLDLEGRVLRTVPPSEALEIAMGAPA